MTYDEARAFLSGLINYEQQVPTASDLALQPIGRLLHALGDPHHGLKIVHVAGTNGKGSLVALLTEILQQAGYRTGSYTSPALCDFEERIRVAGAPISKQDCANHLSVIRDIIAGSPGQSPTYFDVVTAMAFRHFAQAQVDIAVVEVGLGGRSDSTNICTPVISIIASIDYDHTAQLGNKLRSIAAEKAGIIKPGWPAISGAMPREAQDVIAATCADRGSRLIQLGADITYAYTPGQLRDAALVSPRVAVSTPRRSWPAMELGLLGEHQAANAALAVSAAEELQALGFPVPDQAVVRGLAQVSCPARVQIMGRGPLVVLDCCHNPAAANSLLATLLESFPDHIGPNQRPGTKRTLIFGASRDKDLPALITILAPHFDSLYFTSYTRSRRSATQQELADAVRKSGTDRPYIYATGIADAFQAAAAGATGNDMICVTGSVFLAGEFLSFWAGSPPVHDRNEHQ